MIKAWLDLPIFELFAVLIALYATSGGVIVVACFSPATVLPVRRLEGVVAPFFGTVGVLFAFLTGFLANDITDRNRQAARAVQSEAAELRNIYAVSIASVSEMGSLRAALAKYIAALVNDEWPAMARDKTAHSVEPAYAALMREVSDPRIAQAAGGAVQTALINAAVGAGTARSERLALASDRTIDVKWILVLILGVVTQISIGLVHLKKVGAQIAALTVFSIAAVMALGLIGLQERPFSGDIRVELGPLAEVAKIAAE
ncbi:DUF4239 domain-containing protein [Bradyrhizobium sp. CIAT3101]|uniref:bestrophin-like domain n=1 Tax=Bradyrhizobium sp. CIAT3101 TaxID=439387 RepID=UPI0024B1DA56|nr:DUF4239 domain-containing protein [Bradyrhizobium sp. CIAT3101]WFU80643.1 DUF4239 domain-containing protein [Bradyrhizobium sp. CIAT3101]